MHIEDLPDDVLAVVLRAALPATKHPLDDVKDGLELLAVCRRWRAVALPMVFDTVFIECGTRGPPAESDSEVNIDTMLELVVSAKCLPVVRRLVADVHYQDNPFPGLRAVIARLRVIADEWPGIRKLRLGLRTERQWSLESNPPVAYYEDDMDAVNGALAALMPRLREIKLDEPAQTDVICTLFGRLIGRYANQLQVLHAKEWPYVPQDRVFTQLRDVSIEGLYSGSQVFQLPQFNPDIIERLVLKQFRANEMWSMFCADPDDHAITFKRLANLDVAYNSCSTMAPAGRPREHQWALQFPAAKRVRIVCYNVECPSMESAIFPTRLDSLDISAGLGLHQVIARAKVQVSQSLVLRSWYASVEDNTEIDTICRIFAAAGHCRSTTLAVHNQAAVPLELFTYPGLTNLHLRGKATLDEVVHHICTQSHLVSLTVEFLHLDDVEADFVIPVCAEHAPVAPLDTQLRELTIQIGFMPEASMPVVQMLKYLLLKAPTLRCVTALGVPEQPIRDFIAGYVQWYPHLANVKLVT